MFAQSGMIESKTGGNHNNNNPYFDPEIVKSHYIFGSSVVSVDQNDYNVFLDYSSSSFVSI